MDEININSAFLKENDEEQLNLELNNPEVQEISQLQLYNVDKNKGDNKVCRLCAQLKDSDNVSNVFSNEELVEKINNTLPIKVNREDNLTSFICNDCENKVNTLHNFISQVVNADAQLRKECSAPGDDKVTKTIEEIFGADSDDELADLKQQLNSTLKRLSSESDENHLLPEVHHSKETFSCISETKAKSPLRDSKNNQHLALENEQKRNMLDSKQSNKRLKHPEEIRSLLASKKVKVDDTLSDSETPSSYSCRRCGSSFHTFSLLVTHNRIYHHGKNVSCPEAGCPVKSKNEESLREHIKEAHTSPLPVVCNKCEKIFLNQDALKKHKHNKHYSRICNFCWMSFETDSMYKQHMRDHNISRQQECNYCSKMYQTPGGLRRHILKVHSEEITALMGDALMYEDL